ncbi:HPr kinase/phosphorylase [Falsiroseomonas oryzae]|uniref:HPr kinase/phosphorylase n=1 Tax=Falsiroseomonas oryzae TaxID=2766473 RepID=UPI0022EB29B8|nr:HPr kinase/phosphatase C-terminal domain-containing protein [Roseomonas sp. MO-31]
MPLHASCAARGGDGVLFLGPSGAGKSELVLRLLGRGWTLVADDQVELDPEPPDLLLARPPAALRGLLEVRGLGLQRDLPVTAPARLRLVVDLLPPAEAPPRLPEPRHFEAHGRALPRVALAGLEAAAPDKVALALDAVVGRARFLAGAFAA